MKSDLGFRIRSTGSGQVSDLMDSVLGKKRNWLGRDRQDLADVAGRSVNRGII